MVQVVSIALTAQNLLDDVASLYERLHGLFDWNDVMATGILLVALVRSRDPSDWILNRELPVLCTAGAMYCQCPCI